MKRLGEPAERRTMLVPVESRLIDPGGKTAFTCRVRGPEGGEPFAELWMSPEMTRSFVVEEIDRQRRHFRVSLACVAAHPTAFRGCLYVEFFAEPDVPAKEFLS